VHTAQDRELVSDVACIGNSSVKWNAADLRGNVSGKRIRDTAVPALGFGIVRCRCANNAPLPHKMITAVCLAAVCLSSSWTGGAKSQHSRQTEAGETGDPIRMNCERVPSQVGLRPTGLRPVPGQGKIRTEAVLVVFRLTMSSCRWMASFVLAMGWTRIAIGFQDHDDVKFFVGGFIGGFSLRPAFIAKRLSGEYFATRAWP